MKKIFAVIKKEYKAIVKKKSFIIMTILTPVLMGGMMFVPVLLMKVGRTEKKIAVADFAGGYYQALTAKPTTRQEPGKPGFDLEGSMRKPRESEVAGLISFRPVKLNGRDAAAVVREYEQKVLKKEIDGLLLIPADVKSGRQVSYYATSISDFATNSFIASTLRTVISQQLLLEKQIDPAVVLEATRDVLVDTFKVKKEGTTKSSSGMDYIMSLFMMIILFGVLIGYGQMIMRGVLEEKSSRISELLISSAKSTHLFYGKVLGIGLAGLTQVALWILLSIILVSRFSGAVDASILSFLTPEIGLYFVVFFILGFFIYAIPYAIVGAAVNTDQEAQQFSTAIVWMMLIPYFIGFSATQNPNTTLALVASLIPIFSPILMFMRITASTPPLWQIVTSIALCSLTIWGLAWLGAKIFRVGMLMYGKKPTLGEILRWVRYK
ncbi:MAG: ABC transporter permease [Acidobacteria bacterium]|nr:ABC transporter permease [Acidobacteriota bacterium]MBU4306755.1 ABC transporter permease [Acidobacteriota bacterium]MBU4405550.1 ABC transporter permease [Acidobacteriota bacterium]MCG2810339.1 ABC transporter permease [Candidatus Aminicenantes bacterium]